MKKSFLLTLLILTVSFSCEEQEKAFEPEVNFEEASAFLSDMFFQTIQHTVNEANFETNEGQLELTNAEVIGTYLQENYFPELTPVAFSYNPSPNARISEDESHFSEIQQSFIEDLDEVMNNLTSAEEFYLSIEKFRNEVVNHGVMSDEQKFEVLALVEYSYVLHEAIIAGELSPLLWKLEGTEGSRVANDPCAKRRCPVEMSYCEGSYDCSSGGGGCSVNWRSVWGSAVVGLAYGATSGAIAGGTAGTVVFPVVGTVTGAVSAGVVGGAIGFVEGAVLGVAGNLLLTCGR